MKNALLYTCYMALLLLYGSSQAEQAEQCYKNLCGKIIVPKFLQLGVPFDLTVQGTLVDQSSSYTSYKVLQDVTWSYTPNHMVQLANKALPENIIGGSGFHRGDVDETYPVIAQAGRHYTFIFGSRSASHGYYDLAVEVSINSPISFTPISIDIKPDSCVNPFNIGQKGVLPVAIVGSSELDVRQIAVESVQLIGVAPIRHSYADVSTAQSEDPATASPDACSQGGDGIEDLILKFDAQEITTAIRAAIAPRNPLDGEVISLPLTAGKGAATSTDFQGSDSIRIISKHSR